MPLSNGHFPSNLFQISARRAFQWEQIDLAQSNKNCSEVTFFDPSFFTDQFSRASCLLVLSAKISERSQSDLWRHVRAICSLADCCFWLNQIMVPNSTWVVGFANPQIKDIALMETAELCDYYDNYLIAITILTFTIAFWLLVYSLFLLCLCY